MSNINVLNQIIDELEDLLIGTNDKYLVCAIQANLIKYGQMLEKEKQQNAIDVIEYKIRHLTGKLK